MMKGLYLRFGFSLLAAIFFTACTVEPVEETTVEHNAPMYMKGVLGRQFSSVEFQNYKGEPYVVIYI